MEVGASSNGRTQAFGACYPGSNPGAPARIYVMDREGDIRCRM